MFQLFKWIMVTSKLDMSLWVKMADNQKLNNDTININIMNV